MQPGQLYNQLRFNLNQPYDVNKLSVRHKKPHPITIEKASSAPVIPVTVEDEEDKLSASFKTLSLARLKEAQFLAKRDLLRQQNAGQVKQTAAKLSPKPPYTKPVKVKLSPTKRLHHLPVSGNSPPVRDVSSKKLHPNRKPKQLHSPKVKSKKAYSTHVVQTDGVLREKLDDKDALDMPDVHKMAMQQLLQVQNSNNFSSPAFRNRNKRRLSTPTKSRKARAAGVRFVKPSKRAESARIDRERIYRQCLSKPATKTRRPSARSKGQALPRHPVSKGQVLPRHPVINPYDPDYVYVEPELHLQEAEGLRPRISQQSPWLPNANEFLKRMNEAKKGSSAADLHSVDPTSWLDVREKDTRQPAYAHREISPVALQRASRGDYQRPEADFSAVSPTIRYNRVMSSDEQHQHSAKGQTSHSNLSEVESSSPAIYSTPDVKTGNAWFDIHSQDCGEEDSYFISPDDRVLLETMLNRLDEMQKEHVEIRHRWLTASTKYDDAGLIHLGEQTDCKEREAGGAIFDPPRALLLKKPHARPSHNSQSANEHRKGCSTRFQQNISLPENKIKSIQDGKERFEKALANSSHVPSAGFDPWHFAKQTADEALDSCITQVSKELLDAGDGIVQKLYSDEFIAAKRSASQHDITPTT
ncbi:uncharacterized protein [Watersipora subatra]|uniref:uncharacterized protein n=1 Tax=Watersipora subatra TaxID=2589382 RepID=UPI00355B1766